MITLIILLAGILIINIASVILMIGSVLYGFIANLISPLFKKETLHIKE
jgi:hypothetical protein